MQNPANIFCKGAGNKIFQTLRSLQCVFLLLNFAIMGLKVARDNTLFLKKLWLCSNKALLQIRSSMEFCLWLFVWRSSLSLCVGVVRKLLWESLRTTTKSLSVQIRTPRQESYWIALHSTLQWSHPLSVSCVFCRHFLTGQPHLLYCLKLILLGLPDSSEKHCWALKAQCSGPSLRATSCGRHSSRNMFLSHPDLYHSEHYSMPTKSQGLIIWGCLWERTQRQFLQIKKDQNLSNS